MTKLEMIDQVVAYMKLDDGYLEKATPNLKYLYTKSQNAGYKNYTKYWDIIYKATGLNYQGGAWCMGSIFAIHIETLGLHTAQQLFYQKAAINCQLTYEIFREHDRVYNTPEVGDMIVFWNGKKMHHVEYVFRISGDKFWTWGGNTTSDSSIVVDNGGAARYGKEYSIKACKKAGHKFLRIDYESVATESYKTKLCSGTLTIISELNCRASAPNGNIKKRYHVGDMVDVNRYTFCGGAYWFKTNSGWISGNYITGWVKDESTDIHNQWWYLTGSKKSESAYGINQILDIDGVPYIFKQNGYALQDEWYEYNHSWYYADENCKLIKSDWLKYNNHSYYFDSNGKMVTDAFVKAKNADTYYYVKDDGVWDGNIYQEPNGRIIQ